VVCEKEIVPEIRL